jgi:endonuclease/exonuclease/phosphatase family metal-dependent hydrolase
MRQGVLFLLVVVLIASTVPIPAAATHKADVIKVMTRNQYLGADLTPVILAGTPEEFIDAATEALEQVARNYFPVRAAAMAREAAFVGGPDVIALQEVFDFKRNGANTGPPFVDHLAVTLNALASRGLHYEVAATVEHLDISFPIEGNVISVLDRDVILVKKGLTFNRLAGHFLAGGLCGVPVPNPAPIPPLPEYLTSTPSEDGCNYTAVASFSSPVGPITVERGFVGVDVLVRGRAYRVVNSHLEVQRPNPLDPSSAILQSLQAAELVGTLQALTPPDLDLILLGDFNSSAIDEPIGDIVPPYSIIASMGFTDIWDTNPLARFDPDGFTCCQRSDLANRRSMHDERIDVIFVRGGAYRAWARVTGRFRIFPLFIPPNWGSDHGGVFGKLRFMR